MEGAAVNKPLGKVNAAAFVPKLSDEPAAVVIVPAVLVMDPFNVSVFEPKLYTPAEAIFKVKVPSTVMAPPAVFVPVPERVRLE